MSVWDCRPPCDVEGCMGEIHFIAYPAEGKPMLPLSTQSVFREDLPPQALMSHAVGSEAAFRVGSLARLTMERSGTA
jgi:hypothetical protein